MTEKLDKTNNIPEKETEEKKIEEEKLLPKPVQEETQTMRRAKSK
jgi:hypothetical protein